jgi:short-subunit dehydrogenase
MSMFKDRYGPAAIVTGASSGIGEAFARELAARGMDLVLVARRLERLEVLIAELAGSYGIRSQALRCDLSQPDAASEIDLATRDWDIGLLVSNAGFGLKGEHSSNDASAITEMLMVNCNAPFQLSHRFIPRLRNRGRGGIVLISSVEGLIGCPYSTAYSATKALVNALGEGLWAELTPEAIDVLTICPGATQSEAAAKQGIDFATLPHVMPAIDVARLALDNLSNGPTLITSDHYRQSFGALLSLPRREALQAMARAMRG